MTQKVYPSDLSDAEWDLLEPLIPPAKSGGHPRTTDMRSVCNAIFYLLRTGSQWQYLPKDFPPPSTVYHYYRKWQKQGVWEEFNDVLRNQCRQKVGKSIQPSVVITDSQSVETTEKRGMCKALMEGKKSKEVEDRF